MTIELPLILTSTTKNHNKMPQIQPRSSSNTNTSIFLKSSNIPIFNSVSNTNNTTIPSKTAPIIQNASLGYRKQKLLSMILRNKNINLSNIRNILLNNNIPKKSNMANMLRFFDNSNKTPQSISGIFNKANSMLSQMDENKKNELIDKAMEMISNIIN